MADWLLTRPKHDAMEYLGLVAVWKKFERFVVSGAAMNL